MQIKPLEFKYFHINIYKHFKCPNNWLISDTLCYFL